MEGGGGVDTSLGHPLIKDILFRATRVLLKALIN